MGDFSLECLRHELQALDLGEIGEERVREVVDREAELDRQHRRLDHLTGGWREDMHDAPEGPHLFACTLILTSQEGCGTVPDPRERRASTSLRRGSSRGKPSRAPGAVSSRALRAAGRSYSTTASSTSPNPSTGWT